MYGHRYINQLLVVAPRILVTVWRDAGITKCYDDDDAYRWDGASARVAERGKLLPASVLVSQSGNSVTTNKVTRP
jgi:hypothetical protein